MSENPPKRTTDRAVPPARRRRSGGQPGNLLDPDSDSRPSLPRMPSRVRLDRPARARPAPAIGWPHMLVNGSDAEFRRGMALLEEFRGSRTITEAGRDILFGTGQFERR